MGLYMLFVLKKIKLTYLYKSSLVLLAKNLTQQFQVEECHLLSGRDVSVLGDVRRGGHVEESVDNLQQRVLLVLGWGLYQ